MRKVLVGVLAAASLAVVVPATASAATSTLNCPTFNVVRPDPGSGLPIAGYYGRQIFWQTGVSTQLTCNATYHVFFSYLYNDNAPGYTVSPKHPCPTGTYGGKTYPLLCKVPGGTFRGKLGRIFYLNGSNNKSGFTIHGIRPN